MRKWLGSWSPPSLDPRLLDAAITLVFLVVVQIDIWGPNWGDIGEESSFHGPLWLSSLVLCAGIVPLFWRRRVPLLSAVALAIAMSVEVTLVSPTAPFLGSFVPMLVIAYSLAAYEAEVRRALAGFAVLGTAVVIVTLSVPELRSIDQVPFEVACLSGAWLIGRFVHRLRSRAHALGRRAEDLERLRELEAREAVELERTRIARELHDVISHSVSLMGVQAAAAERVLERDPARAREPLLAIQETARDAVDELRRLLGVLRESEGQEGLSPQPGLTALDSLAEQMRAAGLPVELRVEGRPNGLSPGIELSAYRIVQEALTNALRHAGGAPAEVVVRHLPRELEIEVADRGNGNGGNGEVGHGLIGMRERVALYGGTIATGPEAGGGYRVRASLPHARRG